MKMYQFSYGNASLDKDLCETPFLNNGNCVDIIGMKSNGI
jgi:hypothetical protein